MDSITDAQSRVQHARLYLQVLEENLKLRNEIGRLEEEVSLLSQAQTLCLTWQLFLVSNVF